MGEGSIAWELEPCPETEVAGDQVIHHPGKSYPIREKTDLAAGQGPVGGVVAKVLADGVAGCQGAGDRVGKVGPAGLTGLAEGGEVGDDLGVGHGRCLLEERA